MRKMRRQRGEDGNGGHPVARPAQAASARPPRSRPQSPLLRMRQALGNAGFAQVMAARTQDASTVRPARLKNQSRRSAAGARSASALLQVAPSPAPGVQSGHQNLGVLQGLVAGVQNWVQRIVLTGPSTSKTADEIKDMTLNSFHQFAQDQVDWFNNPAISNPQRWQLRAMLTFANRPGVLSGCGELKVRDLLTTNVVSTGGEINSAIARPLEEYSNGVSQDTPTVHLETPAPDAATALKWGRAIVQLLAAPGLNGGVLKETMHQTRFQELIDRSLLDGFLSYLRACHPRIEAEKESDPAQHDDYMSYINMRNEGRDPIFYKGTVLNQHMVNFHRFHRETLDTLITHFNARNLPNAARKPLTLILHSAQDHNAAFHRDPNLLAVVKNPNINTLMIEGKETLAEVESEIQPIAQAYGKNRQLDQVMLAGHGDARVIELGASQDVNLDTAPGAANALFDAILRNMANDPAVAPHRRIVFNACLTNSNSVPMPLNADRAKAQKEVRDHIAANSSLATYLQQRARAQGLTNIEVRGANGSFGTVGLIDSGDGLDITSRWDPSLTASKAEYVKTGTDAQGVLRAVLEGWAGFDQPDPEVSRQDTLKAMEDRIKVAPTEYEDAVIKILFKIILLRYRENGEMIRLFSDTAFHLAHLAGEGAEDCNVASLQPGGLHPGGAAAAEAVHILKGILPHSAGYEKMRLVLYQLYIRHDDSAVPQFLSALAPFNCSTAADFLDVGFITPVLAKILPDTPTPTREQLLVAFRVIDTDNTQVNARDFLLKAVGPGNRRFPAALGVDAILAGRPSQQTILEHLGLVPGGSGAPPPPADDHANLDLDGDGTNETYVEPLPGVRGRAAAGAIPTYSRPDTASAQVRNLWRTQRLFLVGQTGDFYAIHNPWTARQVIFVEKANVVRD